MRGGLDKAWRTAHRVTGHLEIDLWDASRSLDDVVDRLVHGQGAEHEHQRTRASFGRTPLHSLRRRLVDDDRPATPRLDSSDQIVRRNEGRSSATREPGVHTEKACMHALGPKGVGVAVKQQRHPGEPSVWVRDDGRKNGRNGDDERPRTTHREVDNRAESAQDVTRGHERFAGDTEIVETACFPTERSGDFVRASLRRTPCNKRYERPFHRGSHSPMMRLRAVPLCAPMGSRN